MSKQKYDEQRCKNIEEEHVIDHEIDDFEPVMKRINCSGYIINKESVSCKDNKGDKCNCNSCILEVTVSFLFCFEFCCCQLLLTELLIKSKALKLLLFLLTEQGIIDRFRHFQVQESAINIALVFINGR